MWKKNIVEKKYCSVLKFIAVYRAPSISHIRIGAGIAGEKSKKCI